MKVRCIDAKDLWSRDRLTEGKIYEVLREHDSMYRIVGDDGKECSAGTNRFVEVNMVTIVRVGQVWLNTTTKERKVISGIVCGKVYARDETPPSFIAYTATHFGDTNDDGTPDRNWHDWKCVSDPQAIDANARMSYPKPAKQEASNEDMIFFRTPATPGYCVCGIQRNQCDYHRS